MRTLRLRYIQSVDFRKSEATNFLAAERKQGLVLGATDCVLFISKSGNQLIFVHGFTVMEPTKDGKPREALHSEKFRLTRGSWNPLMLQTYAEKVNISLIGIKRFEEYYLKLTS